MAELTRRYVVMPIATPAPFDPWDPDGVFVLKPWKDPAALRALRTYRENCYPELARDLDAWIDLIQDGPAVRGDVGRRNEAHLQGDGRSVAPIAASRPATKARAAGPRRPRSSAKKRGR
jgi:hypothetical protein